MPPLRRWLPLVVMLLAASVAGLAARAWLTSPADGGASALETVGRYGRVPDFSLVERSGRRITRSDLLGTVWIVDFIYTECTDTCPLQSAEMARLQADLANARDVRLASISVDPAHDTPAVLAEYAARFGADPERWLFLTGPKDAIYRLAIEGFRLGVVDAGDRAEGPGFGLAWLGPAPAWAHHRSGPDGKPVMHSSRVVLVDREAEIRGYYQGTDPASLARLRRAARGLL